MNGRLSAVSLIEHVSHDFIIDSEQCSKLRVYPAPCVHILTAGCMDFET